MTTDLHSALKEAEKNLHRIASQRKPLPPYAEVKAARAKVAEIKKQLSEEK